MPHSPKERIVKPKVKSPESIKKRILKECKKEFNEALKNISSGLEAFNATMQNIQEKIAELYKNKPQV